jgi:hypothetical protein
MSNPFEEDVGGGALDPAANPFRPGMGRIPPDFGGRGDALLRAKIVIDQLSAQVAPEFVLYRGVRGVGKTALLAYVRRRAVERGLLTIHLEADRDDTTLEVARETILRDTAPLLEGLDRRVGRTLAAIQVAGVGVRLRDQGSPTASFESLIADVAALAEAGGRGVLLTVDEVHEAGDLLLKPLLRAAHRVAQDGQPFGLLLSGLPTAAENLFDEGQTYTERLARVDLGLLDRGGITEAIERPFARVADARVDELVIDAVSDGSGGYPWFVQLWGEALWDLTDDPGHVALPAARAAGERVRLRIDDFYASRWRRVPTGRASLLVLALAEQGGDAAMADLLEAIEVTHQAASPARRALLDTGLCWSPSRGRLAFSVPGFAGWILRTRPDRP